MNTQRHPPSDLSRPPTGGWARPAGIVAIYALLGPLVGAVGVNGLFTAMAIGGQLAQGEYSGLGRLLVGGLVIGTIISLIIAYAFGIVQATVVGVAVAMSDRRHGGIRWRAAMISTLVVWALSGVAALSVVPPGSLATWVSAILIGHLLATAACTWLARRLFQQPALPPARG